MRLLSFALLVCLFSGLQQRSKKPQADQQSSTTEQTGTQESPLVVKVLPAAKSQKESDEESNDRKDKSANDRNLVKLTAMLAAVGVLQLIVFGYQALKLKQTVKSAGDQSAAMDRHIGEAARSADAMEGIATIIQSGNSAIMRAYLSVIIGTAFFQVRQDGTKFEGKPSLVNSGSTPARNVKIRIAAEIVPFAQVNTFAYPLPEEIAKAPAVAAPHQSYQLSAVVKDFLPEVYVPDIKQGRGNNGALTVWGTVTYDDIFGERHTTKFAHWLFWYPNGTVYGSYIPGQNDMD